MTPRQSVDMTIQRIFNLISPSRKVPKKLESARKNLELAKTNFIASKKAYDALVTKKKNATNFLKKTALGINFDEKLKIAEAKFEAAKEQLNAVPLTITALELLNDHILPPLDSIEKQIIDLRTKLKKLDEWRVTPSDAEWARIEITLKEIETSYIPQITKTDLNPDNPEEGFLKVKALTNLAYEALKNEVFSIINPLFLKTAKRITKPFDVTTDDDAFEEFKDDEHASAVTQLISQPSPKSALIAPVSPESILAATVVPEQPVNTHQPSPKLDSIKVIIEDQPLPSVVDQFDPLANTGTVSHNSTVDLTSILQVEPSQGNAMDNVEAKNNSPSTNSETQQDPSPSQFSFINAMPNSNIDPASVTEINNDEEEDDDIAIEIDHSVSDIKNELIEKIIQTTTPEQETKLDPFAKSAQKIRHMCNNVILNTRNLLVDNIKDREAKLEKLEELNNQLTVETQRLQALDLKIKSSIFASKEKRAHIPGDIAKCQAQIAANIKTMTEHEFAIQNFTIDVEHFDVIYQQLLKFDSILKDNLPLFAPDPFPHANYQADLNKIKTMYAPFFEPESLKYTSEALVEVKVTAVNNIVDFTQQIMETGTYWPRALLVEALQKAKLDAEEAKKDPLLLLQEKIDICLKNSVIPTMVDKLSVVIKSNPHVIQNCDAIIKTAQSQLEDKTNNPEKIIAETITALQVQNNNIKLAQNENRLTAIDNKITLLATHKNKVEELYLEIRQKAKGQLALAQTRYNCLNRIAQQLENIKTFLASDNIEARKFAIEKLATFPVDSGSSTYAKHLTEWAEQTNEDAHKLMIKSNNTANTINANTNSAVKPSFARRLWNNKFTILGTLLGIAGGVTLGFFTFGFGTIPLILAAAGWGVGKGALFGICGKFIDSALEPAATPAMSNPVVAASNNNNVVAFNSANTHRMLKKHAPQLDTRKPLTIVIADSPKTPITTLPLTQKSSAGSNKLPNINSPGMKR